MDSAKGHDWIITTLSFGGSSLVIECRDCGQQRTFEATYAGANGSANEHQPSARQRTSARSPEALSDQHRQ